MVKKIINLINLIGFSIKQLTRFVYYNYVSKNIVSKSKCAFINCKASIVDIRKGGQISIGENLILGQHWTRGSKIETRLLLNENARLIVPNHYTIYAGGFIDILKGGTLILHKGFMNEHVQVTCGGIIEIGEGTAIGRDVVISNHDGHSVISPDYKICEPIKIGKHVWIGQGAVIRKGVTIGDGAIIASYAVVTRNVPPHSIAAGIPAKVIRNDISWE